MNLVRRRWERIMTGPATFSMTALIATLITIGPAFAQSDPSLAARKPDPVARKKSAATKRNVKGKPSPRGRGKAPVMQMNPDAKWACDKTTVTKEPVWRGPKGVSFEFDIRNEGTAPLQIRAKGG